MAGISDGTSNTFAVGEAMADAASWMVGLWYNGVCATVAHSAELQPDGGQPRGVCEKTGGYVTVYHSAHPGGRPNFGLSPTAGVRFVSDSIDRGGVLGCGLNRCWRVPAVAVTRDMPGFWPRGVRRFEF